MPPEHRGGAAAFAGDVPHGIGVGALLVLLARHPWRLVGRRWNYKSAVTSSLVRGLLFFSANLSVGIGPALAALSTELWLRFLTAGYYGALTQAFRRVEPERAALAAASVVLPIVGHGLELLVHWLRGTPNLTASVAVSMLFTLLSTSFNLFAMRRGALIVGEGSAPLAHDLRRLPGLLGAFVLALAGRRPRRPAGAGAVRA